MENVNTLDIDGTQWEITDSQARQDIAELKSSYGNGFKNVQIVSSLGSDNLKDIIRSEFPKLENARGMIRIEDGNTFYCGTYVKYGNTQGSVTFTSIEGISYIWTIQGNAVTLQELTTKDELMELGGREQSVNFPFIPKENGTLIITILQNSVNPVPREIIVTVSGDIYAYIYSNFVNSYGAYTTSIPLIKGKTYDISDPADCLYREKTKFIY